MAGRGSRLSELLKKKEKEPEPPSSAPEPTSASPPTTTTQPPQVSPPPVSSQPPTQAFRSIGRGTVLSSLLNKPQSGQQEPRVIRPSDESPSNTASQFQRISPTADLAKQHEDAPEPITKREPSPVRSSQPIGSSRGRGIASRIGQFASSRAQASREGSQETQVRSRLETLNVGPDNEPEIPLRKVDDKKEKSDAGGSGSGTGTGTGTPPPKKSQVSSGDSKSQTHILSIATASSKSLEKALEELKEVEQIVRKSPVRKMGEAGEPTNFKTNYVKLKCENKGVYQYVVHYDPPVDSTSNRVRFIYNAQDIIGRVRLFDGHTLFLPILLPDKVTTVVGRGKNDSHDTIIKITLVKILPPEQIPPTVFNMIFKNIMRELKMNRIGQHYFSPMRQIDVPNHNLQVWPGYTTAVHDFEDGLHLVIDVAHKILNVKTCWQLFNELYVKYNGSIEWRQEAVNCLVGNVVLTRYNNQTYKIDDIMWDSSPMNDFARGNTNERITYVDYYKKQYDISLNDHNQPLLIHRPKQPKTPEAGRKQPPEYICLIPELCYMTGLSEQLRNDINVKKDLATHTRLSPSQRVEQLKNLIDSIRSTPEALKYLTNWGLNIEHDLRYIQGRTLPLEKIIFESKEIEPDHRLDWTKAAGFERCVRSIDIKNWICIFPSQKEALVERFVLLAVECGKKIGVRIEMPTVVKLANDKAEAYYTEIKKYLSPETQLIFIVLNMLSDARYQKVKKLCCIECPVPSQCVVVKTINKPDNVLRTVAQKIVLQMNVKLGGELWRLVIPIKKIMIVGIDVYHKTEKQYKSIAGFVSSLNPEQTRWYSKVCFQMVGQELTDTLKLAFSTAIKKYQEVNNYLPEKIFIYRDGVSEGQLSIVVDHEIAQLRSCFGSDYCPQMSVIVVQKRISTRIFSSQNNQAVNPKPGAIIDYGITSKEMFDFFLVSQHVGQGTVTPTHYIVAYDDTNFKPDYIQRISYKMTHMYYNWSGTIRVPAPCQYAHKLAFLTGQYLQGDPAEELCNRLFYL